MWIALTGRFFSNRKPVQCIQSLNECFCPAHTGLVGCGCGNLGLRSLGEGFTPGCTIAGRWPLPMEMTTPTLVMAMSFSKRTGQRVQFQDAARWGVGCASKRVRKGRWWVTVEVGWLLGSKGGNW